MMLLIRKMIRIHLIGTESLLKNLIFLSNIV
jgi:hypothetical protein